MITMSARVGDVETVQGEYIRRLLRMKAAAPILLKHYRRAQETACLRRGGRPHDGAGGPVLMRINHGRWIGDCRECATGMSTGRLWPEVRCFGCGAVYGASWPEDMAAIEGLVLQRPAAARHWAPGESPAVLAVENIARGFGRVR